MEEVPLELLDLILLLAVKDDVLTEFCARMVCKKWRFWLLNQTSSVNDLKGSTLMHEAAKRGSIEIVRWLKNKVGCPWDGRVYVEARRMRHDALAEWAKLNGCDLNYDSNAKRKGIIAPPAGLTDFSALSVLGNGMRKKKKKRLNTKTINTLGPHGKILLVEYKKTGELYAMKKWQKKPQIQELCITRPEKSPRQNRRLPYLCFTWCVYQTLDAVYYVDDFLEGGELFRWLNVDRTSFSADVIQFYAAEMVLGIEAALDFSGCYAFFKPNNIVSYFLFFFFFHFFPLPQKQKK
jgi:hypothetical protein